MWEIYSKGSSGEINCDLLINCRKDNNENNNDNNNKNNNKEPVAASQRLAVT